MPYRADPEAHAVDAFSLSWTVLKFYAFPPNNQSAAEGQAGQEYRGDHCSNLANAGVVVSLDEDDHPEASPTGIQGHIVDSAQPPGEETPTVSTAEATGMQDLRSRYQQQGYSRRAADLLNSLRPSTQKVYNTYIHKWKCYTRLNSIGSLSPSEAEIANLLAHMFDQGASYSSVNAARSALSTVIPSTNKATIGSSREVCRQVKGVFEARPALPKHTDTWSVDSVLD